MKKRTILKLFIFNSFFLITFLFLSCQKKSDTLFTLLSPDDTNITFANNIIPTEDVNIMRREYIYNGGGVAVGDFNQDGLQDIFFSGNAVTNEMYLNKGDLEFENISEIAGIGAPDRWSQGVAVVDINNDDKLDIYVAATFSQEAVRRQNMLFVNQGNDKNGIPIFKDLAKEYNVADTAHSANAVFFDYDNDGDLDLYVLMNEMNEQFPSQYRAKALNGESRTTDRLYRNDWSESLKHPVFTDVSRQAKILIEGFGHGVAIVDINQDGWKDIYVTNDYLKNDLFYINNQDGTFTNRIGEMIKHQSFSAMGNDIADINNDGQVDMIALDMLPASNKRKKQMIGANRYVDYILNEQYGYEHQYLRNTLQYNQGINPETGLPVFSEIAMLAGVFDTDWSWTSLFMDFDNDGLRDLLITNGFPKDVTDHDFGAFRSGATNMFATYENLKTQIPEVKIPNYIFKNNGNLTFSDQSKAWGMNHASFTNGTAVADLDNDGDLDIVTNNINDVAFVMRNNLYDNKDKENKKEQYNWLRIKLQGNEKNTLGLGAKIWIYTKDGMQFYEHSFYRGFLSSSENFAHFGVGKNTIIDSIRIVWDNKSEELLKNIKVNEVVTIAATNRNHKQSTSNNLKQSQTTSNHRNGEPFKQFQTVSNEILNFTHFELDFVDFNIQRTLPHKFSQMGPALAVADVNGDGLDDFFVGGGFKYHGTLFTQNQDGKFSAQIFNPERLKIQSSTPTPYNPKDIPLKPIENVNKLQEDASALFFDADDDGDNDLYVASGSYEFAENTPNQQDRLYINDGKGNFKIDTLALPKMLEAKSCVKAADFDGDGDLDLFVGGRVVPAKYPMPTKSYILRNDTNVPFTASAKGKESNSLSSGEGRGGAKKATFTDITAEVAPGLLKIGMVTDALWTDFDNDRQPDLVIVGEFMPITFLKNTQGKLIPDSRFSIPNSTGWWNSITAGDFDNDGDTDYVTGNLGLNSMYKATENEPTTIFAKDFDGNGSFDPVLNCFMNDSLGNRASYPMHSRDDMIKQMLFMRRKFPRYANYGKATSNDVFSKDTLQGALILQATHFQSSYIENQGNGRFVMKNLPIKAQFAPVFGMKAEDINQDGNLDLLMVGNDYGNEVFMGRMDAFYGLYMQGDGKGNFKPVSLPQSGFIVPKDGKALVSLFDKNGNQMFLASQNRDKLKCFVVSEDTENGKQERLAGSSTVGSTTDSVFNNIKLNPDDIFAEITLKNGKKRKVEFYYGDTYFSQSSRRLKIDANMSKVLIFNGKGESREVK